ncbi:MAG: hypothetical protein HUU30_18305 [Burkholderiaceae bacterium]|jgi:hypothetical protein|nr:hypothetical protein [Aquabacterium sp.]NUP87685.1 hypothetical protein [Burkholderiaceae bacterium]
MNRSLAFGRTAPSRLLLAVGLGASLLLSACGERTQTTDRTTRKSDEQAWAGVAAGSPAQHTASGWKAGDSASWEAQLKARTQGQNDYVRPPSQR